MHFRFLYQIFVTALLLCLVSNYPLLAQDSTAHPIAKKKSEIVGGLFSWFIPGSGHVYAGRPVRGAAFLAGELVIVGVYISRNGIFAGESGSHSSSADNAILVGGLLVRLWEFIDLFKCIDEYNSKSVFVNIIPTGQKSCVMSLQCNF